MMRLSLAVFALCCGIVMLAAFQDTTPAQPLRVIPTPQQVISKTGRFKFSSSTRIVLGEGTNNEDTFAGEQINAYFSETKDAQLKIVSEESVRKLTANFIYLGTPRSDRGKELLKERKGKLSGEMDGEGYFLDVANDGITIIAQSPTGRFYGVMTLLQMIGREKKSLFVPGVSIHDWPLQSVRGITDDLSRGQVSTMENFKKIIRFLGRYKLNIYSPYFEDIFLFKNHPLIGKSRGEITAAEMKELDVYAKKYHVELIPIFETLGHWENILAMPQYVKYAEFPGAHTVNISDETVYKMLDEMIGEIASAVSSEYFNIAADESWDVGLGVNKERVSKSDIATVHAEHYKRLFDIVKKHKKKPMMYGDIILSHPEILTKIPKDVIFIDWQYHVADEYGSPSVFKNAGFPFVVSPAVWNFTGPFPNYINTFVNIQNLNREGYLNGSLGVLTSNWNDYGGEELRELNYYGYAWSAECAWQPLRANAGEFNQRFFSDFFGSPEAAVAAQSAYAILSDPLNQMYWNELWRHPMLPTIPTPTNPLWRMQSIESTMPFVRQLLQQVREHATRNKDHVQYLEFVSRLNLWFARKLHSGETIRKLTQIPSSNVDSVKTAVLGIARDLVPELNSLKTEFRRVWMTTNREANLSWLMLRYDRQAAYWEEKMEEVTRGNLWVDPIIESQWIYHPRGNPRTRDTSVTQVPAAFFRKTFVVDDTATTAKLQLIGDTHAKIWVNGVELGEVFARRSLSLTVEHQRVRLWHLSGQLKKGLNVIAVESKNYDTFGSAGVNVYAELQSPGKPLTRFVSDSTWKVSNAAIEGWAKPDFNDASWILSKTFPYPLPVIRPNFATGRLSWIER